MKKNPWIIMKVPVHEESMTVVFTMNDHDPEILLFQSYGHFQVHKSKWPLLPGSNQGSSPRFPCWHSSLCVIRDDRNDGQTDKNGKWCRQPVSLPKTSFLRLLCITYLEAYAKKRTLTLGSISIKVWVMLKRFPFYYNLKIRFNDFLCSFTELC